MALASFDCEGTEKGRKDGRVRDKEDGGWLIEP